MTALAATGTATANPDLVKIILTTEIPLIGAFIIGGREYKIHGTAVNVEMAPGEEIIVDCQFGRQILGKVSPADKIASQMSVPLPKAWMEGVEASEREASVPRGFWAVVRELWPAFVLLGVVVAIGVIFWSAPTSTMAWLAVAGTSGLIIFGGPWGVIGLGYAVNIIEGVMKGEFGKLWEDFWSAPMLHATIVGLPNVLPLMAALTERTQGRIEGGLFTLSIPFLIYACFVQREERRFDGSPLIPLLNGLLFGAVLSLWPLSLVGRIVCGALLVPVLAYEFFKKGQKLPGGGRALNRLYAGIGFIISIALALLSARPTWAVLVMAFTLVGIFLVGIAVWTGVRKSVHMGEASLKTLDIFPVVILEVIIVVTPWLIYFIGKISTFLESWVVFTQ